MNGMDEIKKIVIDAFENQDSDWDFEMICNVLYDMFKKDNIYECNISRTPGEVIQMGDKIYKETGIEISEDELLHFMEDNSYLGYTDIEVEKLLEFIEKNNL